jgi:hypothetical protein
MDLRKVGNNFYVKSQFRIELALVSLVCASIRLTRRCKGSMARHPIPRVIDDHLIPAESASTSFAAIQIGSQAWYAWLNEPATRSFAFSSPHGTLTARREQRHGSLDQTVC